MSPAALVADPGRPDNVRLASRFVRSELRAAMRRLSRTLGLSKLHDALPADWTVPDSAFALQAVQAATALCPDFMLRHCYRSYCFGAILAARNDVSLNREVFFVAAMLHDLGLSDTHADDPGSFEWVGAKLAHSFCLGAGASDATAALIHNAIALHTSVGIVERQVPEVALLHYATGMDLFGMRLEEIPRRTLDQVLEAYPRTGFKADFSPCLAHQANTKPQSNIAGAVGVGLLDRLQENL